MTGHKSREVKSEMSLPTNSRDRSSIVRMYKTYCKMDVVRQWVSALTMHEDQMGNLKNADALN